jgi:hypothetical protein
LLQTNQRKENVVITEFRRKSRQRDLARNLVINLAKKMRGKEGNENGAADFPPTPLENLLLGKPNIDRPRASVRLENQVRWLLFTRAKPDLSGLRLHRRPPRRACA